MGAQRMRASVALFASLCLAITVCASASALRTFTSERYHYALGVPAGWHVKPATVNMLPTAFPNSVGPETDMLQGPGTPSNRSEIGVASVVLNRHETLRSWTATMRGAIAAQWSCTSPTRETRHIDGAHANVLIYQGCVNTYFIELTFVHAGRGYNLYWISPEGHESHDKQTFFRTVNSFSFTG